jgi:selenocysteine lyase/cysteine desulfurase
VHILPLDDELRLLHPDAHLPSARGLLAFPAQSNFSGVRHPLPLVERAKSRGYDVLLDVAGFVPSHTLSLRDCPADFAALSFYKLFGYPTGLGALIARRDALSRLNRPWFAGGTVLYASVHAETHRLRPRHDAFEDGTQNFLGIAALAAGFAFLDQVGMPRITAHVFDLASTLLTQLLALHHPNGTPLVRVYGPRNMDDRGGTIAFNLLDRDGHPLPYPLVETRATGANLALRGGCFCNPGAAEAALGLDAARVGDCLTALGDHFTPDAFATCLDAPVGAVRVSLGLANNDADVRRAIAFVASFSE